MKITVINKDNMAAFSAMIHEEEKKRIASGQPVAALGVVDEETAIGVLTGRFGDDETFVLTNIFVVPGSRRMGAATMLLDSLLMVLPGGISVETEVFFDDRVLKTISKSDEERSALCAFLEARGFIPYTSDEMLYAIKLFDAIKGLEPYIEKCKVPAKSFAYYSPTDVKNAGLQAINMGLPIPAGGFPSEGIDNDLSSLVFKDGELKGYLIVDRFQGSHLTISGLYADNNPKRIAELFAGTLTRAMACLTDDYEIIMIPVISRDGERMVKRVFPMAKKMSEVFCLYR